MRRYEPRLKPFARQLRANLTDAERRLWHYLRGKQLCGGQFYRQRPVGPYILDFYAPKVNLVIEVDGGQHYDDEAIRADQRRTAYLNRQGLTVVRFTNIDVMRNLTAVLEVIFAEVSRKIPPDPPFSKGGNGR